MDIKYNLSKLRESDAERKGIPFKQIVNRLKRTWKNAKLEICKNESIEEYYFRKTYTLRKIKKPYLDPMDPKTWNKRAIRTRLYDQQSEGLNGIVVLGCVTNGMVPQNTRESMQNPQTFAMALKNELINHFTYQDIDPTLRNDSFQPGRQSEKEGATGIIYVAYRSKKRSVDYPLITRTAPKKRNREEDTGISFPVKKVKKEKRMNVKA